MSVEVKFLAKRSRLKAKRRVTIEEEPIYYSWDAKLNTLVKTMERMMERISLNDRDPPRENQDGPPIRNSSFRRNAPQIKYREQRGLTNQQ